MKQWEYLSFDVSDQFHLDLKEAEDVGLEGWELVSVTPFNGVLVGFFKRPVEDPVGSSPDVPAALEVALRFGGIDGDHHKSWVIDQMVRALTGDGYEAFVADAEAGEDGPDTYPWDEGIPP